MSGKTTAKGLEVSSVRFQLTAFQRALALRRISGPRKVRLRNANIHMCLSLLFPRTTLGSELEPGQISRQLSHPEGQSHTHQEEKTDS